MSVTSQLSLPHTRSRLKSQNHKLALGDNACDRLCSSDILRLAAITQGKTSGDEDRQLLRATPNAPHIHKDSSSRRFRLTRAPSGTANPAFL